MCCRRSCVAVWEGGHDREHVPDHRAVDGISGGLTRRLTPQQDEAFRTDARPARGPRRAHAAQPK